MQRHVGSGGDDRMSEAPGSKPAPVYVVHCVDTEGPLAEAPLALDTISKAAAPEAERSLDETEAFDRNLEETIRQHRGAVLESWEEIISMLRRATSQSERELGLDDFGGGWIFNWFCMDHIGFVDNPRRRAMGIHQIYDFFRDLADTQNRGDAIHWHFHPMSSYREANKCATSYLNSPELWEILCRRLIERKYFPAVNRAGFQDERPDSHWFLEQWIPFDFSNLASEDMDIEKNPDMVDGRMNDWRWAPKDWSTFTPDHDCYMLPGNCRRKIARCLTVLNRVANLVEAEVNSAFERASNGYATIMAFSSHDWRDLVIEMRYVRHLLEKAKKKYPTVPFKYAEAAQAFNEVHGAEAASPVRLNCQFLFDRNGLPHRVNIETAEGKLFGPQPFLAIRTRSRRFIHDNLNYWQSLDSFNYVFDEHSISPDDVSAIGIATNDFHGRQSIHVYEVDAANPRPGETVSF